MNYMIEAALCFQHGKEEHNKRSKELADSLFQVLQEWRNKNEDQECCFIIPGVLYATFLDLMRQEVEGMEKQISDQAERN